jgi:hypothetical protein
MLCLAIGVVSKIKVITASVSLCTYYQKLLCTMQLSRFLLFLAVGLCRRSASAAGIASNVSAQRLSNEVVEINIQIEVKSSLGLDGVNSTTSIVTHSLRQWESKSFVTVLTAGSWCGSTDSTSTHNGTLRLPIAPSDGIFTNSTSSRSATGSFQTPSQVEFAPFFSDSALAAQIDMLFMWSVAGLTCAIFVIF